MDAVRESLAQQLNEALEALRLLCAACDTGHRNADGSQQGVRVPEKEIVIQARAILAKHAKEKK